MGDSISLTLVEVLFANATGYVGISWMIWNSVVRGLSELLISPASESMVGALTPRALQGSLLGFGSLMGGLSAVLPGCFTDFMILEVITLWKRMIITVMCSCGYA